MCLKMALTLDGRIADRTGSSRWVTGSESRAKVHELRNKFDAVLIGGNTLKADDPELTVRDVAESRNPVRVAIDSRLSISPSSRFCTTNPNARTLLFTLQKSIDELTDAYPAHIELLGQEADGGQVNITLALQTLAQNGINSVLCEGGGRLAGSLLAAGLIDEVYWVIAPKFIGDVQAIPALQLDFAVPLGEAWHLNGVSTELIGSDIWIHGTLET